MRSWKHTVLGSHIDLLSGFAFSSGLYSSDDSDVKLLRGDNVIQGQLRWDGVKRWSRSNVDGVSRYLLRQGDIVLAMDRTWVNAGLKCALVNAEDVPCLLVQRVARIRGSGDLDTRFLYQMLRTHRFTQYVKGVQTETAIPHISSQQIREFPIHLPPLPEQQKIAAILSTWDQAIELTQKLIAAKQKRKQALMQQLLTGKEVKLVSLSTILKPTKYPVAKPDEPYTALGIRSHCKGTFQRPVDDPQSVAMDTLYAVRSSELIVNITFAWEGAIAIVKPEDEGCLVSHRFPTYAINPTKADLDFVRHLVTMPHFIFQLGFISPGGAGRNRVLSKTDFLKLKIKVPPLPDQARIGRILMTATKDVTLLMRRLEALKQQKKGLMQQLLTGKVRVTLNSEIVRG